MEKTVSRKLIIDGNAVYEIDEECMLRNRLDIKEDEKAPDKEQKTVNKVKKEDIRWIKDKERMCTARTSSLLSQESPVNSSALSEIKEGGRL